LPSVTAVAGAQHGAVSLGAGGDVTFTASHVALGLGALSDTQPSALSRDLAARLQARVAVQGNLDPAVLVGRDRQDTPLSLLLIDFDLFKSVNDELGHQHGDLVLQMGARIVRAAARAQDLVARYGGDELAVLVADTNAIGAQRLAYRIVDAVHAAAVSTTPGQHLTFSVGVSSYPEDAFTASELIAAADQALYLAKREGKDRACTFPQLVTELELADGTLVSMLADAGPQVMVAVAHAVDHDQRSRAA